MILMSLIGLKYYINQLMFTVQLIFTTDHHSNLNPNHSSIHASPETVPG